MKSNPCRRCEKSFVWKNRHKPSYTKECSKCEKRKSHEEYLESQRKYIKGEPITSLEELDKYNGWVIWGERTTHVSVIKNLPFHLASRSIMHGGIRKAIKKESDKL